MVYAWARWLKPALEADPFIARRLITVPGWETRGRGPELGFSFLPSGILDHHTACMVKEGHDPQSCLNGIIAGNGLAPPPVSQLLGTFTKPGTRWTGNNPDPHIVIVAAGRCNHAGGGEYPWGAPAGNGSAIGVEWCGPPAGRWPGVVMELRERVDAAILRWNGWTTRQVTTHWEYVQATRPGAKVDPSGAWYGEESLGQTEHWDPDLWRTMIDANEPPPPPPTPPPTGSYTVVAGDGWYAIARKTGMTTANLLALNGMTLTTPLTPGMGLRVATATPPPPPAWVTPPGNPSFGRGATDSSTIMTGWLSGRVSWLQDILAVPVTGAYDAATVAKMIELQRLAGIVADGVYGPQTAGVFLVWRGQ